MPPRKNKSSRKTYKKKPVFAKYAKTLVSKIKREIALDKKRHVETKRSCFSTGDGLQIFHNNFLVLDNHILKTTQGTADPTTVDTANRIGDKITVKGVSLKFMIEMNERYSDVTYRILIVRSAKGDTPTTASLFNGLSANKMLDTLNKERYTVVFQKYYKLKSPGLGVSDHTGSTTEVGTTVPPSGAGIFYGSGSAGATNQISRATKICKIWIPGTKFARNGVITYENGASQVKFYDYHVMLYAYSNYSTNTDWYVARVNDYISQLYFTDQ